VVALLACALAAPPGATAARPLITGFSDGLYVSPDASVRQHWLDRTVAARAGLVRLNVSWRAVVGGSRPANPRDPLSPSYDFSGLDPAVRDASQRGLHVLLTVTYAPDWAEGSNRHGAPGTWKPQASDYGDFAYAVAKRYSGSIAGLPRVRYFQAWNEPNLSVYLTPQFKGKHLRSPDLYRGLLNSFYGAVHAVHEDNVVVTAGTAPYGDPPGRGDRTRPLTFWRKVLCLRGVRKLAPTDCPTKAHADVLAHHPIDTSGGPHRSAINPNDAATPDFRFVRRTLRAAERHHTILPEGHRPLWATELWWESDPPDPSQGVPLGRQACWLEEALHILWRQGAQVVINLQIRDSKLTRQNRYGQTATGIFFHSGKPKPSFRAWRFPFVAHGHGGRARVWGLAPHDGEVSIERKRGGRWRTVKHLEAGNGRVFAGSVHVRGRAKLRARQGGERSLAWQLR
jgi:hypothetical protein